MARVVCLDDDGRSCENQVGRTASSWGGREEEKLLYAGCDLGVATAKVAVVDEEGLLAFEILPYSGFPQEAAAAATERALARVGVPRRRLKRYLSTGFGGKAVPHSDGAVPDTACLQRAVRMLDPGVRTVVSVGGHSFSVFHIRDDGGLGESAITDMCTAGMGLMLETVAVALDLPLDGSDPGVQRSGQVPFIDNRCPIFVESEAISLVNEGHDRRDVQAGVTAAVANKIAGLTRRLGVRLGVAIVGGVAKNRAVVGLLERNLQLGFAGLSGIDPQIVAAYGAALLAQEGCSLDTERLSGSVSEHLRRKGGS